MRPHRAMVVLAAITLPMALLPTVSLAASPQAAFPLVDVQRGADSGPEALRSLGAKVDQAAALNGLSTSAFTEVIRHDKTAHLDEHGRLYYVEPALEISAALNPDIGETLIETDPEVAASVSTVPPLHSRPTSTHKIYLDFDGITLTSASAWTSAPTNPIPAGTYDGFSLDGSPDFSSAEVAFITKVQAIVAEKYAAFDVDVTTVDPGQAGYSRTGVDSSDKRDENYGVQVVITNDPDPVQSACGGACAGVAYTDVFDRTNNAGYAPAWVFSSKTFGSAQMTAHDAAHEIGHTFGLTHDGVTGGTPYYAGHANWVPIMGITNQNAIAQFSRGEYAGANNAQDDLAVIGANGDSGTPGSLLLADDHSDLNAGTPTALDVSNGYAVDGVIGDAVDDDVFMVTWPCSTPMTVTATGIGAGQGVDLGLQVYDAGSRNIATDNPASGQRSAAGDPGFVPTGVDAEVTVPTGVANMLFGFRIDGSGNGTGATGYTDYGSTGQYRVEVGGCPLLGQPNAPGSVTATPHPRTGTGTIAWTAPSPVGADAATGYRITGLPGGTVNLGDQLDYLATGLIPGTTYNIAVRATNARGSGQAVATTLRVPTWAPPTAPSLTASGSGTTAVLRWTAPPNPGQATVTGWRVLGSGPGNALDLQAAPNVGTFTISGLPAGTHSFTVTGQYGADDLTGVPASNPASVPLFVAPSAPRIGVAAPGARGRPVTATARWSPPVSTGGAAITSYRVLAHKLNSRGRVVQTLTRIRPASARSYVWRLPAARYKFKVVAINAAGASSASAFSRIVLAR